MVADSHPERGAVHQEGAGDHPWAAAFPARVPAAVRGGRAVREVQAGARSDDPAAVLDAPADPHAFAAGQEAFEAGREVALGGREVQEDPVADQEASVGVLAEVPDIPRGDEAPWAGRQDPWGRAADRTDPARGRRLGLRSQETACAHHRCVAARTASSPR